VSVTVAQLLVLSSECLIYKITTSCKRLHETFPGLTSSQTTWLAFLSSRRDTYIIPTANCLGYIKHRRNENGIDPNRDFPYSRRDNHCLLSSTAKIFYELMKHTLIQVVVTFHGGMLALGYEWGSRDHLTPNDKSPDDLGHRDIADMMAAFSGEYRGRVYKRKLFFLSHISI
jgi:hypothetical protein